MHSSYAVFQSTVRASEADYGLCQTWRVAAVWNRWVALPSLLCCIGNACSAAVSFRCATRRCLERNLIVLPRCCSSSLYARDSRLVSHAYSTTVNHLTFAFTIGNVRRAASEL